MDDDIKKYSAGTIKTYECALKTVNKFVDKKNNMYDIKKLLNELSNNKYSLEYQKTSLSAILYYLNTHKIKVNESYLLEIQENMKKIRNKIAKINNKNILSKNQQKNYISFEEITNVYKHVKKQFTQTMKNKDLESLMIMAFYTLMPPRRSQDLYYMVLGKENSKLDKEFNYYIKPKKGNPFFIFNRYKTAFAYGQYKQPITNIELIEIIDTYIAKFNLHTYDRFFKTPQPHSFVSKIQHIFSQYESYKDKKISVSIIRHAYITYMVKTGQLETLEQRLSLAKQMSHEIITQLAYYKTDKFNDISIRKENVNLVKKEINKNKQPSVPKIFIPNFGQKYIKLPQGSSNELRAQTLIVQKANERIKRLENKRKKEEFVQNNFNKIDKKMLQYMITSKSEK